MNKIIYILLWTALAFAAACNRESAPESSKKKDASRKGTSVATKEEKPLPEDVILVGDGQATLHSGDNVAAIETFNKAIAANPKNADAYYWRAVAKCYLKDNAGCCKDYEEAARLGHPSAKEMLEKYCGK